MRPGNPFGKLPMPPREKRYGWFRYYNDHPHDPKWRAVAKLANVPIPTVISVTDAILCTANKSSRRGCVEDFNPFECAEAFNIPPDDVARVLAALEGPEIAWIDQDWIVDWFDRQPDSEDPTAKDRQRRRRARQKAVRLGLPDPYPPQGAVQRHDSSPVPSRVTPVTLRDVTLDKTRQVTPSESVAARAQQGSAPQELNSGGSGESFTDPGQARMWLFGTGTTETGLGARVVADALGMRLALTADQAIRRWNNELEDPVALANIIREADALSLNGKAFENIVQQQIARHLAERINGPSLPLPLTGLKKQGT